MTRETKLGMSAREALELTRDFFLGPDPIGSAWLESESERHLTFATFRGNLAVAAHPDPEGSGRTRVRVSTLRNEGIVPRLITFLELEDERVARA